MQYSSLEYFLSSSFGCKDDVLHTQYKTPEVAVSVISRTLFTYSLLNQVFIDNGAQQLTGDMAQAQPFSPYRDDPNQISPFQTSPYDSSGQIGTMNDSKRERFAGSPSTMQRAGSPYHPPSSPSIAPGSTHVTSSPSEDLEYASNRPTSVPPAYDALVPLRSPTQAQV